METCCAVCTEPLMFCAFGPCHHQEVCSKCMARLRLIDKNMNCPICREECPIIYVTRFMDDHTLRIAQDQWEVLKGKASRNSGNQSLFFMKKISAVFDDREHYQALFHASSLTHPLLEAETDVSKLQIRNIGELKKVIKTHLSMSFCDLCLKHRPVFTSEQVLYAKASLAVHMEKGDSEGPLKEANFKGHPKCSFCKTYFFDQTELFKHMEKHHYHCHICRRENPDNYKYFKDYAALEEHFEQEHFLCPFPECRAAKFVVFSTEAELQRHIMTEHKDDISMKRHERRSALQLETGFTTGRMVGRGRGQGQGGYEEEPAFQNVPRPPTVIGGGGAGAIDMRRRANEDEEEARRVAAQQRAQPLDISAEEHFPGLANGASHVPLGAQWGRGGGYAGSRAMQAAFPSLADSNPLSKGQKKKLKAKSKRNDGGVVRMGRPEDAPPEHLMQLGQLQPTQAHAVDGPDMREESTNGAGPAPDDWTAVGSSSAPSSRAQSVAGPSGPPPVATVGNSFAGLGDVGMPPPGLGAAGAGRGSGSDSASWVNHSSRSVSRAAAGRSAGGGGAAALGAVSFPSLNNRAPAAQPQGRQGWITLGKKKPAAGVAPTTATPSLDNASAFPTLSGPSGEVQFRGPQAGEDFEGASDALVAEIKAKLSPSQFRTFKACSADLASGNTTPQRYHATIVKLGLATSIPQLVQFCPSDIRRSQVMAAHQEYINFGAMESSDAERWEPPEAVRAAAQTMTGTTNGASSGKWSCAICTLMNDASLDKCNACGTPRVVSSVHAAEESAAAAAQALGKANIMSSGKKKKAKKVTMSFQDVNRTPNSVSSAWGQR